MNILRENMIQFVICFFVFQSFVLASIPSSFCRPGRENDSIYIPYQEDCSKFWKCSNGEAQLHDCPDGLHFNSNLNICDNPDRVGCSTKTNNSGKEENDGDNNGNNDNIYDGRNENNATEKAEVNICQKNKIECPEVDGKYPVYSALPDCTKFCQCSNGKPYLHDCPDGLHFNSVLNVCDWPYRAGCDAAHNNTDGGKDCNNDDDNNGGNDNNSDGGNMETTSEKPEVNICQQNEIECPKVDGKYPVYSALPDCTKFCQCSNGKPYLNDCPDGLHFNAVLNVCDWPHRAGCNTAHNDTDGGKDCDNGDENNGGNDNICDGGNKETVTEKSDINICQQNGIECPKVDGKYPVYSALIDCTKFCQCSNGKPYLHDCPDGLHFNFVLNVCDWPHKAGCDAAHNDKNDGKNCGNGDNNNGGNDNNCDGGNKETITDKSDVNICQQNGIECPKVDGKYPVYSALPDCTKFCQCSNGKPYLHDCPDGLHFNSVLNVCDWPYRAGCDAAHNDTDGGKDCNNDDDNNGGNDNNCDGGNKETTSEKPEVNICQQNGIECPKVDGKYPVYSALPDCTKFCQCSNGKPYLHDCPDGLHFNSVLNVCDWPHEAACDAAHNDTDGGKDCNNDDDITTEEAEVNVCQQQGIECPKVDGEYPVYSALPDCTKFCQCSNGKPYLHHCPNGLHFNPELNVCDWQANANCSSNSV